MWCFICKVSGHIHDGMLTRSVRFLGVHAYLVARSHDRCIMSGTVALSHDSVPLLKHRSPNFITYDFSRQQMNKIRRSGIERCRPFNSSQPHCARLWRWGTLWRTPRARGTLSVRSGHPLLRFQHMRILRAKRTSFYRVFRRQSRTRGS